MEYDKYYVWSKSLGINSDIYQQYIEYVSHPQGDNQLTEDTQSKYLHKIKQFLSQLDKPFIKITISDIEEYINNLKADSYKNNSLYALMSFISFVEITYRLLFTSEDLKTYIISQKDLHKKNAAEPLTFDDIIRLRSKLNSNDKYIKHSFIFELVYAYGLDFSQLLQCNRSNYEYSKACFSIDGKVIFINKRIQHIINQNDIVLDKMSKSSDQKYFNDMGLLIKRSLEFKDVKATFMLHSMKCPVCQRSFLCESDYWYLISHKEDLQNTRWLICKECAVKYENR